MVPVARPRVGSLLLLVPAFGLLVACSAASGTDDESAALSADHRRVDAGAKDAGAKDAAPSSDAATCNATGAWTSPFSPPSVAGIDWTKTLSVDDLIAADCDTPIDEDGAYRKGDEVLEWNDGQMFVEYDAKTHAVNRVESYFPFTISFHSREGGAYGTHEYIVGQGKLTRDGTFMDVLSSAKEMSELLDGYTATFFPEMEPAAADCVTAKTCATSRGSDSAILDFNLPPPADLHLLLDEEGEDDDGTPIAYAFFPDPAVVYENRF